MIIIKMNSLSRIVRHKLSKSKCYQQYGTKAKNKMLNYKSISLKQYMGYNFTEKNFLFLLLKSLFIT